MALSIPSGIELLATNSGINGSRDAIYASRQGNETYINSPKSDIGRSGPQSVSFATAGCCQHQNTEACEMSPENLAIWSCPDQPTGEPSLSTVMSRRWLPIRPLHLCDSDLVVLVPGSLAHFLSSDVLDIGFPVCHRLG
jgi:hypothetical protein